MIIIRFLKYGKEGNFAESRYMEENIERYLKLNALNVYSYGFKTIVVSQFMPFQRSIYILLGEVDKLKNKTEFPCVWNHQSNDLVRKTKIRQIEIILRN